MDIRLSKPSSSGANGRPPVALIVLIGLCGIAIVGGGVWVMAADAPPAQQASTSPEVQKLLDKADARRRETREKAALLRQKDVGDEFQFDDEGRLIGPDTDVSDLPPNRHLAQVAPAPAPAPVPFEAVDHRQFADTGGSGRQPERFDRELVTRSMLAYSTVRSAAWAAQRPSNEGGAPSGSAARPQDRQGEGVTEGRVLQTMERMAGGGQAEAVPHGRPSADSYYPATREAHVVRRGEVGDMQIGGNVGAAQIVRQGKFLDCAIVNELKVDLVESPVTAMVSRDFLSLDGSYVIVPAGARLLGTAGTVQNVQQARVYIKFERVVYPDQRSAYFPSRDVSAVDGMGSIGVAGDVNRHFMLQFGAAVMLGVLDGLAASVQTPAAIGSPTARDLVLARTSSNFSSVVGGVINRYANVVPTVTIPAGSKMKIFFAEDVRMSPYMRAVDLAWSRR